MADFEDPTLPAPILYQLIAKLRGQQADPWSIADYAMGLGTGPQTGFRKLMTSGPKTPTGVGSLTGQAAERPWVGVNKGALSEGRTVPRSYTEPNVYDLTEPAAPKAAKYLGTQEVPGGEGFKLYNLADDIIDPTTGYVLHPRNSTVGEATLRRWNVPFEGAD